MISCCGTVFINNQTRALMETPAWYVYAMCYDLNFDNYIQDGIATFTNNYIPNGITNFTNNMMFRPVSRLSSRFIRCFLNTELMLMFVGVALFISISLNVFLYRRGKWKESPPKPENADWQGIWRGLGKILGAWRPAGSWDFILNTCGILRN